MPSLPLFDSREAAAVLGVTSRTVQRWVREEVMHPAKRTRGGYVFTGDEIARVSALPKRKRGRKATPKQVTALPFEPPNSGAAS